MRLRPPSSDELALLTELCLRSKAMWGYDHDFISACRAELTLTDSDLSASQLQVAELAGSIVGVAQLYIEGHTAWLGKLFVEPERVGEGLGGPLFRWAVANARRAGASTLVIESDPDAIGFYHRMGAVDDGTAPSGSIPGRALPRLTLRLE